MDFVTAPATAHDIPGWMSLLVLVADAFPGLDKQAYETSLAQSIQSGEAICARDREQVVGGLLFSAEQGELLFLAVHPGYRRQGVAARMITLLCGAIPQDREIWVTTYREEDPQGAAARALYLRCGFVPGPLVTEMDYPCQKFVLRR